MADNINMVRLLAKLVGLSLLLISGVIAVRYYIEHNSTAQQVRQLQEQKLKLEQIVQRLSSERRAAEVLVTEQKMVDGQLQTTLLWVEYANDQTPLPARTFSFVGDTAHVDALVIQFEKPFLMNEDTLRGQSIALFTRLFGEHQTPADGYPIDAPGKIPDIYRGGDPRLSEFEKNLWADFWRLTTDKDYAQRHGVRVAYGQSVWTRFVPKRLYTLRIEADGGVNITSDPLRGIYSEALDRSNKS